MITIRPAGYGYILTTEESEYVFLDSKDEIIDMLNFVVEQLGEAGSRHDADRITISLQPGDKWHDGGK